MSGEFHFFCEKCGRQEIVYGFPKCPKCGLSGLLCDTCMPKHNCKAAREEKEFYDRHPD